MRELVCFAKVRLSGGRTFIYALCLALTLTSPVLAKQREKSHAECIKEVPGDWGPNFGAEWHEKEALYWACRLGESAETLRHWQEATGEANANDVAQDILVMNVAGQKLVLFEEMGGRFHCFDLKALKLVEGKWKVVWQLPVRRDSKDYCSGTCPRMKLKVARGTLVVESATTSDPDEDQSRSCEHPQWRQDRFHWNGSTFVGTGEKSDLAHKPN